MAHPSFQHIDISPAASDFLELLRELGHLDEAGMDELTGSLMRHATKPPVVELADVRRAAAIFLFDAPASMRPEARDLLASEWGRLFG
jgi:hypothetical protein